MRFMKKKYVWAAGYSLLLVAFTLYVVLDTFVITRAYTVVSDATPKTTQSDQETESKVQSELGSSESESSQVTENKSSVSTDSGVISENHYSDENINITITEYREYETAIYVADVTVSSAEYLKTAFAQSTYGRNITEKTSEIAAASNAILAINGDFYGAQTEGYVLRNGVLYRESGSSDQEDLVIWTDGSFDVINEGDVSASELLNRGAQQVLSFGPALIMDGTISVTEDEEVGKAKASNPRTAIATIDDLHYLFVVSDGRTSESKGLSLYELAEFMTGLGAKTAYNLDGGGSSTMYFNGQVINNPTTNGRSIKERSLSDIVYIGY